VNSHNNIPPTDHISRLCYGKSIDDGNILGAAFLPRPGDDYLSVNWLEYLRCPDQLSQVAEVRRRYANKFRSIKKKDRIAILNVEATCLKVQNETDDNRCLRATHEPEPEDDSHSGLWEFSYDDIIIGELILQSVTNDFPAVDTP